MGKLNVGGSRYLVVTSRRSRRLPETTHIRHDDRVCAPELIEKRNPHVRDAEPVNPARASFSSSGLEVVNLCGVDIISSTLAIYLKSGVSSSGRRLPMTLPSQRESK